MGKKSRNKGRQGENEWAKKLGGKRISQIGLEGPDVLTPPYQPKPVKIWEVKRIAKMPALLRDWFIQMERDGSEAVAFRADRDSWYTIHPFEKEDDGES